MHLRFDDSLRTVLSAGTATGFGASAAWRQLVDLMGRGRIGTDDAVLARLRMLRPEVPVGVRAASARALAFARPPASLVALFAEDELMVAAPVLRAVELDAGEWPELMARLTPPCRAVLRGRRDLPAEAVRALESFGSVDFTLVDHRPAVAAPEIVPAAPAVPRAPLSPSPFMALGDIARSLPLVAEALRQAEQPPANDVTAGTVAGDGDGDGEPSFAISDIVARIDAFRREHPTPAAVPAVEPPTGFRFLTDAAGVIRWVDGVGRAGLVGVALARPGQQGMVKVDAGIAASLRRRARFIDLRLEVEGAGDAAGSWRVAGMPDFDRATGRFTGFAGTARRPFRHESAAPVEPRRSAASDSLRQLVHELRTPANAVAGFSELIAAELIGPVPETYRERAEQIGRQAADLIAAIDDLDTAARLESSALDLRASSVALRPLIERVAADLATLIATRGAVLELDVDDVLIAADDRAVERVVARLLATLVAATVPGERIGIRTDADGPVATIVIDRPGALGDLVGNALFSLDDLGEEAGGPLLGAGFTLRLVRNLAAEMGGSLTVATDCLTLCLPAVQDHVMEQASSELR
ncbi:hypothetical protein ASG07_12055 [Sphingomonas sp. Leaf343]|nr:hypothetical protein ASG07_12055 [Sphingomonas sp. Leaf343]